MQLRVSPVRAIEIWELIVALVQAVVAEVFSAVGPVYEQVSAAQVSVAQVSLVSASVGQELLQASAASALVSAWVVL